MYVLKISSLFLKLVYKIYLMNMSEIKLPTNRKFGFFFSFIFFIFSLYFFFKINDLIAYFLFIISILFFILAKFNPDKLLLLNTLWMKLGIVLGIVVTPIVMGIIYFSLFVPIGLILRIIGRDELRIKNVKKKSFWRKRSSQNNLKMSFKNQF